MHVYRADGDPGAPVVMRERFREPAAGTGGDLFAGDNDE